MNLDRRCHANINLSFGDGRLNIDFDPSRRIWNLDADSNDNSSDNESAASPSLGSIDVTKLNVLNEKKNELTK